MTHLSSDIWAQLAAEPPSGERLVARLAASEITDRLLCALDSEGNHHLLMPLREGEAEIKDTQTRGISVEKRELSVPGQSATTYIDIECRDRAGNAVFDVIAGEMLDAFALNDQQPAEIVSRVFARWKRFWGEIPLQLLSRQQQIGLFGEIWFLSNWLIPQFGANAVNSWRGPFGSRHDFEWNDRSYEVKTTTSTRGRIHRINGLDQLDPPENGPLFFFSLTLREEVGASHNLPSLIQTCHQQLLSDDDSLSRFESALFQIGYSPAHEEEYSKVTLRIIEQTLFDVKDNFPRLGPTTFSNGVPFGIERIEYQINLNTFDDLILADSPEKWLL